MANQFQPPPTWANPMLESTDAATGEKKTAFNPVWLKWFLDLTYNLTTTAGSGSGGGGTVGYANVICQGPSVIDNIVLFDNAIAPFTLIKDSGLPFSQINFNFADCETPTGVIDGANTVFTLGHNVDPITSLVIFHKLKVPSINAVSFTVAPANTVTFAVAPAAGDWLRAFYRY